LTTDVFVAERVVIWKIIEELLKRPPRSLSTNTFLFLKAFQTEIIAIGT
jgi:hypothetical protein